MSPFRRPNSPAPPLLRPLAAAIAPIYAHVVRGRNRRFDAGERVRALPVWTIAVGNITVGGTGKTPTVMRLVEMLKRHGHRPLIAMRGYRASDGHGSDEAAEYERFLPDTPVVANPRRHEAVSKALQTHADVDCVVLDDGFQHRQLARHFDLVLVDATRPFWLDASLPLGTLREPASALSRADAVLITRCEQLSAEDERAITAHVERMHGRAPRAWSRHHWLSVAVHEHGREKEHDTDWLSDRPVVVLSAIGNPSHFVSQVRAHGAMVIESISRRDHHHYTPSEIETVAARADAAGAAVFVTHKDWVKIRHLRPPNGSGPVFAYPRLDVDIYRGQGELEREILASQPEGA